MAQQLKQRVLGLNNLTDSLRAQANSQKARVLKSFFKTGPGDYGEGDQFLGLTVPQVRATTRPFTGLPLSQIALLLASPWHEYRLAGVLILVARFNNSDDLGRQACYDFYLRHTAGINNWDLVDLSAPAIVGAFLQGKDKAPLFRLVQSSNLWERRIAMVACLYDIRRGKAKTALQIARMLLLDTHDLMHKAVGWMLREVGKHVSPSTLEHFLQRHYEHVPRTSLRYAIEHFPKRKRQAYLKGVFGVMASETKQSQS